MYRTFKHNTHSIFLDYSKTKEHVIASTELNDKQCFMLNLKDNTISRIPSKSFSPVPIQTNDLILMSNVLKQLLHSSNIPEKILNMDFFELHN